MRKTMMLCGLMLTVLFRMASASKAQEDPGLNFPPYGSSPKAQIEFYEEEIKKCHDYLDDLSIGINKARVLFNAEVGTFPMAGYGWSMEIDRFEREVQVVCHTIQIYQRGIQNATGVPAPDPSPTATPMRGTPRARRLRMPPKPRPTPTASPSSSPLPTPVETESGRSADPVKNERVEDYNERVKFTNGYRQELSDLKQGAEKIFKEIDDYVKRNKAEKPLPSPTPGKKGSPGKGVLIGGGAALIGGAVALGGGGGTSTSSGGGTSSGPPPTVNLAITPTGRGLAGLTSYAFSAAGNATTWEWNFGDSGTASGQSASHVYATGNRFTVTLTGRSGSQSASASGSVDVGRPMTGSWGGAFNNRNSVLTFGGAGPVLSGSYRDQFSEGLISGTISSGQSFVCPCDIVIAISIPGVPEFRFEGQRVGDQLVGAFIGQGFRTETVLNPQ